jgi:glycosyltransferase involved in cell wall biosynthesis
MFLIDCFFNLLKEQPESILLLVGEGPQSEEVQARVEEYRIEQKVIFLGIRSDISDLLQAMDVFVLPSLYEGLPVALVEAQAAGLPCVISDGVPLECKLTDAVEQVKLSDSPQVWAEKILSFQGMPHRDNYDLIVSAGFDIKSNAKWLEEFYCNAQKG